MPVHRLLGLALISAFLLACGEDEKEAPPCDPVANTGCDAGLVCEATAAGGSLCAAPVVLTGSVFPISVDAPVENARVVALDVNGAPVSTVTTTDAEGLWELPIPHTRNDDGTPVGRRLTLRVDAPGFQTFPSGIRQALPLDTAAAVERGGRFVVDNALTHVRLVPLPEGAGRGTIVGRVDLPDDRPGVLVVAEKDGAGFSGIADRDGNYAIFNLSAGTYSVAGYTRGVSFERTTAEVADDPGASTTADLARGGEATASLSGKVSIVNPGRGKATSIILVVESLFDEINLRGESPPGLRAPRAGLEPDVTGAFTIDGIPAGSYVVLAAFENDFLVRDPDTTIGGTTILRQTLAPGQNLTLAESFKITGALDFLPPLGLEPLGVTAAPTISWEDDSSEDAYELVVYDALGEEVWRHTEPGHSGSDPAVPYGGPLQPGMYYQAKIRSLKSGTPISQTEDLAGIFHVLRE